MNGLKKFPILAPHALLRMPGPVPDKSQPPLDEYFNSLFTALGPQHWWPAKTPFEVVVGAILTQRTSWTNVETALANLSGAHLFTPATIEQAPWRRLQRLIPSSGYWPRLTPALQALV